MSTLLDLTPVVEWGAARFSQWSIVWAPVMFIDEPLVHLKVSQADPARDGPVQVETAPDLDSSTLTSPIKRLGLHEGDAVALVGLKIRPAILVSAQLNRARLCVPIYSHKTRSRIKPMHVAALTDPTLFPIPATQPVLDEPSYARLDRLFVCPEALMTSTTLRIEPEATKILEGLLFGQFTGQIPDYIESLRRDFA